MELKFQEPTAETRCQVMEAWGYTPDQQVALEQHIDAHQMDFNFQEVGDLTDTEFLPM
jgi:hypothetical protein